MIFGLALAAIYAWMAWELWPRDKPATALCILSSGLFLMLVIA